MDKKVAYETIKGIMNERCQQVETLDWYDAEITVQKVIPFQTASGIVRTVADACFHEGTGEYMPEMMNIALRMCVFDAYTDIEIPDDPEEQNLLLFGTGLWDKVTALIDEDQLGTIELAANRRIKARLDTNRAEFEHAVNTVVESMEELGSQMAGLLNDVTPDDIRRMIAAVGENGIDEAKIVQAVVAEQNKVPAKEDGE